VLLYLAEERGLEESFSRRFQQNTSASTPPMAAARGDIDDPIANRLIASAAWGADDCRSVTHVRRTYLGDAEQPDLAITSKSVIAHPMLHSALLQRDRAARPESSAPVRVPLRGHRLQ